MLTLQRNVANGRNKKKRRVSLSYILALIVAAYLLFVYLVMARFYDSGGKEEKHPNNGSASSQLRPKTSSVKKQATLDDFCGSCIYKDSTFNCNERIEWVIKNKHMTKPQAIMANLMDCLLKDSAQYDVDPNPPQKAKDGDNKLFLR